MWTYAGRDPAFAAQLVETDAAWEREIRAVLERAREAGLSPRRCGRRVGRRGPPDRRLGLLVLLDDRWEDARARLVHHMARSVVPGPVLRRMHARRR